MSEYRINKVHFKILNPKIKVWLSRTLQPNFHKKKAILFSTIPLPDEYINLEYIYFSFESNENAIEIILNIEETKYFIKPYVDYQLTNYFSAKQLQIRHDFIQSTQVWQYLSADHLTSVYDRFSLRQLTTSNIHKLEMLISYDGKSLVSKKPLSELNPNSHFSKYFQNNSLFDIRWRLLLQVDSNEEDCGMMWGDVGRLYFWIRKQDLENKKFDKSWFSLQCS